MQGCSMTVNLKLMKTDVNEAPQLNHPEYSC